MKLMSWRKKRSRGREDERAPIPANSIRSRVDQAFTRFLAGGWPALETVEAWNPSVDVVDGEKEVTVRVEVPGIDPKDLEVSVAGGFLMIAGEKKSEHSDRGRNGFHSECRFGSFLRTLRLPEGIDSQKVSAEHANGVLKVRIAKSAWALPTRILVSRK